MPWFRLRPTFEISLDRPRALVIENLRVEQSGAANRNLFLIHGEYGELHLPPSEHRLWSPHLSFYVFERDNRCWIHGRFAPRVNVWTSVWIVYLATAFTAFFGFTLAISQWLLQTNPWGLWVGLAALALLLGVYVAAHLGQQWSADQMHKLRAQLENCLDQAGVSNLNPNSNADF